jgi:N-acetylglutamate synthase-like GNAT family acetyltransferase
MNIRPARPDEAAALSELALRSKAHWGYDAEFLDRCRAVLSLGRDEIEARRTVLAEEGAEVQGFYTLDDGELGNLWIDPGHLRRGVGRRLWVHATETARALGFRELFVVADPHAEGFYRAMGAVRVGEVPSEIEPGRRLPRLRAMI